MLGGPPGRKEASFYPGTFALLPALARDTGVVGKRAFPYHIKKILV